MGDTATAVTPEPEHGTWALIGALMMVMLVAAAGQTIVSTALPAIVGEFAGLGRSGSGRAAWIWGAWVVVAYLLAVAVSSPLWGRLGDRHGHKALLLAAIGVFLAASAMCALAQSMIQLIVARAVQGLGGGGLTVLAVAVARDFVPPRERGRCQVRFGGVFAFAVMLGPILGGLFADYLSWRWIFIVNLPIAAAALFVVAAVPGPASERTGRAIDYAGVALLGTAATCALLVVSWSGTGQAWGAPVLYGLMLCVIGLLLLWGRAGRWSVAPVLPPRLFSTRVFAVASAIGFAVGFTMMGTLVYLPPLLQLIHGVSATASGLALTPMMIGMLGASIGSARAISRTGRYRSFPIAGMAIATVALVLLHTLDEHSTVPVVGGYLLLLGAGLGMVVQALVLAVQNVMDYRDLGVAVASAAYFRLIGGSFGVITFGVISSGAIASGVVTAGAGKAQAYSTAMATAFLYAAPVALAAFLLGWLVREVPLRGTARASAADLGEGYAMPSERTSQGEIEHTLTLLMRGDLRPAELYEELAEHAGYDFPAGTTWALVRVAREGRVARAELARRAGVTVPDGMWCAQPLLDRGMVEQIGDDLVVTPFGRRAATEIVEAREAGLARHLAGWTPGSNPELAALLSQLTVGTVGDDADGRHLYGHVKPA